MAGCHGFSRYKSSFKRSWVISFSFFRRHERKESLMLFFFAHCDHEWNEIFEIKIRDILWIFMGNWKVFWRNVRFLLFLWDGHYKTGCWLDFDFSWLLVRAFCRVGPRWVSGDSNVITNKYCIVISYTQIKT